MNNATSLAIAAILMAATLIVGATFSATTAQLTAFAYQKKKVGGTQDGGSKNGNTVTIEECKNRGSASGFDTALDQECENLICTHPGENATCVQEGAAAVAPTPQPTPPGPSCPEGSSFNFNTGQCEAQPTCASGAPPNSQGQCVTTTTSTPATCTGTLNTETGQCTTTTDLGLGSCGDFSLVFLRGPPVSAACIVIVLPGTPCPSGTTRLGGGNACQSDITPIPVCSSGTLNTATGHCETTTTTNVCPSTAVFQSGQCVTTTTTTATCPPGTALSGNVCAAHPIPRGPQRT